MQSLLFTLSSLVLAGHGYEFRSSPSGEAAGDDDGAGLSMEWIAIVFLLAVVTVVVLMWLNRGEREPGEEHRLSAMKLRSVAPVAIIVAIIVAPLALWTTASGGDDKALMVERFKNVTNDAPELLISLGDEELNKLTTTGGKTSVRIECIGRQGQPVLTGRQKWPFIRERGYEYPHAHQAATPEQVQRADECRVRGTRVTLEADVEGALTG
jgi:heme/copper-type cytochrome/quinol oxidase subunit 2